MRLTTVARFGVPLAVVAMLVPGIGAAPARAAADPAPATAAGLPETAPPAAPVPEPPLPSERFAAFGDYGSGGAAEALVAALVEHSEPDFVVTTGDNSYAPNGIDDAVGRYYSSYIGAYQGSHGPGGPSNRFFPALGNHDLYQWPTYAGLPAYLDYFTLPGAGVSTGGTSGTERYYDVVWGPVHVFVVDANPAVNPPTSAQGRWLEAALAASIQPWNVVVMHQSPYSSGTVHGSTINMQWPYERWGADLVLSGHDHDYERIKRDDDLDGRKLTYVVSGLGGANAYPLSSTATVHGSRIRYNQHHGSSLIDVCATNLAGQFRTVTGEVIDRFSLGATFRPAPSPPHPFTDVPARMSDAVAWNVNPAHRYAVGFTNTTFRPTAAVTRGDAARWFYRLSGSPDVSSLPPLAFSDVPPSAADAIRWLTHDPDGDGPLPPYANGFNDATFRPLTPVSRAAGARMLYRLAGSPDVAAVPSPDFSDVPDWADEAVRWLADPCPAPRRTSGYADGTFHAGEPLRRGQLAVLVFRLYAR